MTKITIKNKQGDVLKVVDVDSQGSLLGQLEKQDVEIPNACRMGMCAACMCNVEKWAKHIRKDMKWEPAFPLWEDEVMTCIGWVEDTDEEIILRTMY